jgi:hypothetical protein
MIDIGLKFTKSAYITPNFVCKKSEFYADFKLVGKGLKNVSTEKLYAKPWENVPKRKYLNFE